jgi:hypothetical protein
VHVCAELAGLDRLSELLPQPRRELLEQRDGDFRFRGTNVRRAIAFFRAGGDQGTFPVTNVVFASAKLSSLR